MFLAETGVVCGGRVLDTCDIDCWEVPTFGVSGGGCENDRGVDCIFCFGRGGVMGGREEEEWWSELYEE